MRVAAQSFRENPAFKTEDVITELAVGEALVSFLDPKGVPLPVERALILPPESLVGAISAETRQKLIADSRLAAYYLRDLDRDSAYEYLEKYFNQRQQATEAAAQAKAEAAQAKEQARAEREAKRQAKENPSLVGDLFNDVTRAARRNVTNKIGREISNAITRGVLGGLFGRK